MSFVAGAGAALFVLSTIFFLWLGSMQVNVAPPLPYPYSLEYAPTGSIAGLAGLLHAYLFVFVSGLLAYGWLGVLAMAAEGAKYSSLLLTERMAATEFFFALPQLIGLAGASLFSEAAIAQGSERKKKLVWAGALSAGGLALLLVFYFARGMFFK